MAAVARFAACLRRAADVTTGLAIFVKTPGHSPIKTRLAATMGESAATEFHCRSARAVADVAQAAGSCLEPYWAVAECAALDSPLWHQLPKLWQGDGSLGERLHHVYAELRIHHECVLLIGADAPQITPGLLRQAIGTLQGEAQFVLGEACDGGFWLFGGRAPISRDTWCCVRYSQADTCIQLRDALHLQEASGALPTLADVDTAHDLSSLAESLSSLSRPLPAQRTLMRWLIERGAGDAHPRPGDRWSDAESAVAAP